MAYRLGVDLGTTYTAAALNVDGRVEMLSLGNRATQIASVLYVKEDGTVLVGEPAEYRGAAEPTRLAREFKRRIGGVVPIIIGGSPYSPQALLAKVLGWAVEKASQQQGAPPEHVCVTYPANWGPFKQEILEQVLKLAGLRGASTCTEPEAAAIAYAARDRVPDGARLAVYDLGGGTFDAAVLVREGTGFRLVGTPDGVEHLGGIDFDAAVFQHVLDQLGSAVPKLDDTDPPTLLGLSRLRRDCVTAKETLSSDDDTVIPVALPGISTSIPITRAEFEEMVRPAIGETVSAMHRALGSAGVTPAELHAIVMVGGSSRIPLVGQELSTAFGRPLALDNHPKHEVALGAAIRAGSGSPHAVQAPVAPAIGVPAGGPAPGPRQPAARPGPPSPAAQPPPSPPQTPPPRTQPPPTDQPRPAAAVAASGSSTAPPQHPESWPGPAGAEAWSPAPSPGSGGGYPPADPPHPEQHRPDPYHPDQYRPDPYQHQPGRYQPGHYQSDPYQPDQHQRDQYQPDQYQPDHYQPDHYQSDPYRPQPPRPEQYGAEQYPPGSPSGAGSSPRRWVVLGAVGVVVLLAVALAVVAVPRLINSANPPTTESTAPPTTAPSPAPPTPTTIPPAPAPGLPASDQPLPDDVIVWPRLLDGNWAISTIFASGEQGPDLVNSRAEDSFPVISPDRRTIIYTRSTGPGTRELRVMGADGSGERRLFEKVPPGCENVTRPAFGTTPRPQLVLPCVDPATGDVTLTVVATDGTVLADLGRGWHSDPALTPDGKFVLYWQDNETRSEGGAIMQQPVDLGAPVAITKGGSVRDNDPAVSPKNDQIAITRAGQGIWTVSLDARHTATQLTNEPSDQDPSWSPDATQITFKRRDGEMWVMNADGSDPRRISAPGEVGTASAWTPR